MRFTAASIHTSRPASALDFEIVDGRLLAVGIGKEPFDLIVHPFDPSNDIFYRTPEPLTPEELEEEIGIHVPVSLHNSLGRKPVASSLGDFLLIQMCDSAFRTIPLFAALKKVLLANETVNSAILHAEEGGIAYVRNAGIDFFGGTTVHSLREFLELSSDERNVIFPDIHAANILVSGSDVQYFDELKLDAFSSIRKITIADLEPLCGFSEESRKIVTESPHIFSLTIGAAAVYSEIITSLQ